MGRANNPYRRLNQSRESFGIARGTAGFSTTVTNTIEGGFALTLTWNGTTTTWDPGLGAQGRSTGVFAVDNPTGVDVSSLSINTVTDEIENLGAGTTAGDTITLWVF